MKIKKIARIPVSEKKDYFDYVQNVLGVKSILLNQEPVETIKQSPLVIYVENYINYSPEEMELLSKMIAALKIDLNWIRVVDLDNQEIQSEFTIYFVEELNQNDPIEKNKVRTYSPRILLKNSKYKKKAWDDLQVVIKFFQNK